MSPSRGRVSANSDDHRIGMATNTGSIWPSLATLGRAALAVLAALLVASAGVWLLILDSHVGPSAQRVNIRWTPDTAADPDKRVRVARHPPAEGRRRGGSAVRGRIASPIGRTRPSARSCRTHRSRTRIFSTGLGFA